MNERRDRQTDTQQQHQLPQHNGFLIGSCAKPPLSLTWDSLRYTSDRFLFLLHRFGPRSHQLPCPFLSNRKTIIILYIYIDTILVLGTWISTIHHKSYDSYIPLMNAEIIIRKQSKTLLKTFS